MRTTQLTISNRIERRGSATETCACPHVLRIKPDDCSTLVVEPLARSGMLVRDGHAPCAKKLHKSHTSAMAKAFDARDL